MKKDTDLYVILHVIHIHIAKASDMLLGTRFDKSIERGKIVNYLDNSFSLTFPTFGSKFNTQELRPVKEKPTNNPRYPPTFPIKHLNVHAKCSVCTLTLSSSE